MCTQPTELHPDIQQFHFDRGQSVPHGDETVFVIDEADVMVKEHTSDGGIQFIATVCGRPDITAVEARPDAAARAAIIKLIQRAAH